MQGEGKEPSSTSLAETELCQRVASGDRGAAQELGERVMDTVVDTVRYLSYGHRDADDFVQISLTEVMRSAGNFTGSGSLCGWARRITVRSTMRQLKKLRRRGATVSLVPDPGDRHSVDESDAAMRSAVRTRLAALMQRLKPERRVVVVLRHVFGLSIEEIASETNESVRTVRFRLQSGSARLRKLVVGDPVLSSWREEVGA